MNTESSTPTNALEGNEEFVAFLHGDARRYKIPSTCDKAWLANEWKKGEKHFAFMFVMCTGKTLCITDASEFYKQAAETYKG